MDLSGTVAVQILPGARDSICSRLASVGKSGRALRSCLVLGVSTGLILFRQGALLSQIFWQRRSRSGTIWIPAWCLGVCRAVVTAPRHRWMQPGVLGLKPAKLIVPPVKTGAESGA